MTASTEVSVIEMESRHTIAVARLEEECFSAPWTVNALEESAFRDDTLFLVAERHGEVIGYVGSYLSPDSADITNVAVLPSYRRLGVARALIAEFIRKVKEKGLSVVLATNPIFPAVATKKRICWAGLKPEDFEFYTTYENSFCSKPNPKYYTDIAKRLNLSPEECLMVGNDVREDMVAQSVGMKVFLLTDCIINKDNTDISVYPSGDFNAFIKWLDK